MDPSAHKEFVFISETLVLSLRAQSLELALVGVFGAAPVDSASVSASSLSSDSALASSVSASVDSTVDDAASTNKHFLNSKAPLATSFNHFL